MLKIAARIFDLYDDDSLEIAHRLGDEFAGVKVAERDEVEALPDFYFGLIMKTAGGQVRRRYPLHTDDAIKLSRAYFDAVKSTLPEDISTVVEAKIKLAEAGDPTVKIAYVDATTIKPTREKVAFVDRCWGLVIDGENKFPLHDADLVKTAAHRFAATAEGLEPEEAFLYARNIAKRASQLGVKIADDNRIHLYTNDEVNLAALKFALDERRNIFKAAGHPTEVLDQLEAAAGCMAERGVLENDDSYNQRVGKTAMLKNEGLAFGAAEIIGTLQQIDKLAGFSQDQYLRGLLDPFAACFRADFVTKRAAVIVDGMDLSTVSPEALAGKFEPEFCQQFQQQPVNAYNSLPTSMKSMIRQLSGNPNQPAPTSNVGSPTEVLAPRLTNGLALGS